MHSVLEKQIDGDSILLSRKDHLLYTLSPLHYIGFLLNKWSLGCELLSSVLPSLGAINAWNRTMLQHICQHLVVISSSSESYCLKKRIFARSREARVEMERDGLWCIFCACKAYHSWHCIIFHLGINIINGFWIQRIEYANYYKEIE